MYLFDRLNKILSFKIQHPQYSIPYIASFYDYWEIPLFQDSNRFSLF